MDKKLLWWQSGVVYQIYPRSFYDSNCDGIGDLQGIIQKIDYLHALGIKAIWISPIFPSPMADFGYDISDYEAIHPIFGSMKDFDMLLEEVHARGMKLLLDFVPNHTSDKHPWFIESRSSKDNPRRDWYMWYDALPDGSAPNNWLSVFGGSAWEWDHNTQQYYYHGFLKEQPDLNWRNPQVQEAMLNAMRFWLDKGVDGFRVDVAWHMIKDAQLRDNPPNPDYLQWQPTYDTLLPLFSTDQPEVHAIMESMRQLTDEYEERVLIAEIYLPIRQLMLYYGTDLNGAHLPFNFQLISLPWKADVIARAITAYESALPHGGWPNWVLGNHDRSRIASRIGEQQARIAALLLLTLRGTPTMYYGDELGLQDVAIPKHEIVDPQGLNMPDKDLSRDPFRTPMQWNNSPYAGFSIVKPWLRVSNDFQSRNTEAQERSASSILNLYKEVLRLRKDSTSLSAGSYREVFYSDKVLAYLRYDDHDNPYLIVLNFTDEKAFVSLKDEYHGQIVVSASLGKTLASFNTGVFEMPPNEGYIVRLRS